MLVALHCLLLTASANLLTNGDLAKGLDAWTPEPADLTCSAVADPTHGHAVTIAVPDSVPVGYPKLYQNIQAKPGQLVEFTAVARSPKFSGGTGPYVAIEFFGPDGKRITWEQAIPASFSSTVPGWMPLRARGIVPEGTAGVRVCLIFNGHGEGQFAALSVTTADQPKAKGIDGPVTLDVTNDVPCASLIGFGAEDDGWFYNEENANHGVTKEDWALREKRIEWMNPSWVRMFFWCQDWNPSGDWKTFDFDTPNMRSHYQSLDLYQRLGTRIDVTGVEWGAKDPFADPAKVARALGALFEHLIRVKGYTCVQDWTLSNEPNGWFFHAGYDFERFKEIHVKVKEEFARRGLKVRIMGSDDTDGFGLFEQCVKDKAYYATADYFSSHRYIQFGSRHLLPYFLDDRVQLLAKQTPPKQLIIAEFGFHDGRSGTLVNPIMETYPYAIWTSAFVIDGLNRGVAGFCIWCLHEMYYPGNGFMNYALWDYKDRGWAPRPVYHAWAPFTRFARPGDRVRRCQSSHDPLVLGTVVKDTLFWVNQSDQAAEVHVKGFEPKEVRIMSEGSLEGDRDCGKVVALENGAFSAPPMSFGYAR